MKIFKLMPDLNMNLALLADEQESMILKYLNRCFMYVLDNNGVKSLFA